MRRPALLAGGLLALGIGVAHQAQVPIPVLIGLNTAVLTVAWGAYVLRRDHLATLLTALVLALAGALKTETTTDLLPRDHLLLILVASSKEQAGIRFVEEWPVELYGRVIEEPRPQEDRLRFRMMVDSVWIGGHQRRCTGEVLVGSRRFRDGPPPDVLYGDTVRFRARVSRPSPARNPGAFDYRLFLERKGIYLQAYVKDRNDWFLQQGASAGVDVEGLVRADLWGSVVLPARQMVRSVFDANLAGGPAGLLKGMLLGEKHNVPERVQAAFSACGVNHVLAVSGLHVGLIAAVVFFGTRMVGLGRSGSVVVSLAALAAYACLTGFPPSVLRAVAMASAVLAGSLLGREVDGLNALECAGVLLLSFQPLSLFDLGFQLSFLATGSILLLHKPVARALPIPSSGFLKTWIGGPLAVSLAAQLGTAPLIAGTFGQFALISPAANLVVVPLIGIAVSLGLLTVLVSAVSQSMMQLLNGCSWLVLSAAIRIAEGFAWPSWASVSVVSPSTGFICTYALSLLLMVPGCRTSWVYRILIPLWLVSANVWVWGPFLRSGGRLEVTILDVGQGDGVFVRFPNGRTMLVDGGLRGRGVDAGERVIEPFLKHMGVGRIDVVVASHPHSDHIGGLVRVLEQFDVGAYVDSGQDYDSWTARRIRTIIGRQGIRHISVAAGDSLAGFGEAGALILHPDRDWVNLKGEAPHGLNNGSVVMRLTYGKMAVLLTGDIEHETDRDLIRWGTRLRSQILKAAHHGSRTSSSDRFLEAVGAKVAAISCGIGNKFRHPSPEVVRRLDQSEVTVYRTDLQGAIRLEIGKEEALVKTWLTGNGGDILF